ncbi:hypothetical protein [Pseudoalteromonas marina]|uniref:hypothetical protein n=1 Tax=Pseudoalteromonas marina TaxID=267375 RepID=UPI0035C8314C
MPKAPIIHEVDSAQFAGQSIQDIAKFWTGKRRFRAKAEGYEFDLFSNTWLLDLDFTLGHELLSESRMSGKCQLMIRRLLALRAGEVAPITIRQYSRGLSHFYPVIEDFKVFQQSYHKASDSKKRKLKMLLAPIYKRKTKVAKQVAAYFQHIYELVGDNETDRDRADIISDPQKGAYADEEYHALAECVRQETLRAVDVTASDVRRFLGKNSGVAIAQLSRAVGLQLMPALLRRPTQLVQLKWADVIPIGVSFAEHDATKAGGLVEVEQTFSDVEQLHIRTFRGKEGTFRLNAEKRSHRIDPDLSDIIMLYRSRYQQAFKENLDAQGIQLTNDEWVEIIFRSPLLIGDHFFFTQFETKTSLFNTLGRQSKSLHLKPGTLTGSFRTLFEKVAISNERTNLLKLSNNRIRHTALTNGARDGYSKWELAALTGVTADAVEPYLDLDFASRLQIDSAFAELKMFKQFDRIGVSELQQQEGFRVLNEFEEEQGIITNPPNCGRCKAATGKPLGCYGCGNFRPYLEADHRVNLQKAERKLTLNQGGTENVLKPLVRAITYIKATILVCDGIKKAKGIAHES